VPALHSMLFISNFICANF